ncbi:2-keto-4-pentenoate hydratase [bacterium K02(2017)]|nr:2-keto-4-pentenoate hydratase [bacterium K02(2017)]
MKLGTLNNNTRDGELVIVSKDLVKAIKASSVATTLQKALDNWEIAEPKLNEIYQNLNNNPNTEGSFNINFDNFHSPLPRAYAWADGSAYVNHVELVRKARGATMPEQFWTDPLMYQGGSDTFLRPTQDIPLVDFEWGLDFEAEIAVITDDTPMHINPETASQHIKLFMLVNDVSLRNLIPSELSKGFGFFQSKPSSAFSPIAITPDEFGTHLKDNKVHLPLESWLNNKKFGAPNAGVDMTFDFSELVAHAAKSRPLSAGTIIGSGTVSNLDRSKGSSCLAEKRMLEKIATGEIETPFMNIGDQIKIEMFDENGKSIFGKIDQKVVKYT